MYENQFLKFTATIDPQECGVPLPVVFGGDGISFFVNVGEDANTVFTVVDASGVPFKNKNGNTLSGKFRSMANNYARKMFYKRPMFEVRGTSLFPDLTAGDYVAPNECFRIKVEGNGTVLYSNLLRRYENPEGLLALVEYSCGTETFGLPFANDRPIRQWLPIIVKDPKPEQKDEIYTKLSGERVVMYATIDEKYSCETDYIPYEWHKRIVMALSCDTVKINGTRLTKSESYEIDWENKIKLECGEKLTKAEWKMVANITSRNSNN